MQRTRSLQRLTSAAMLIALGIIIPMFMPKVVLEPASYTLASHVPIFIAMFISPAVAACVAIGTTIGFFISTLPVIALRAASHLIFALLGSLYLKKFPGTMSSLPRSQAFSFVVGVVHAAAEIVVVTLFYTLGNPALVPWQEYGYAYYVLALVGVGGLVHSMVDFGIAMALLNVLVRQKSLSGMFTVPGLRLKAAT